MNDQTASDLTHEVPGSYGLPLLGRVVDTLDLYLIRGWREFFRAHQRRYGPVFRSNAFMRTITILDHRGFEPLFNWDGRLKKEYGFGWIAPPPTLVGDTLPGIFASGQHHAACKHFYMALLRARASTLLPTLDAVATDYFERWERLGIFSWRDEIERFYATFFFRWFLRTSPDPDDVRLLYNNLLVDPFWRLKRYLPWSHYSRSTRIFPRLLSVVMGAPAFDEVEGIARTAGLADREEAAKQLLFTIGVNCYLGLQNLTKSLVGELTNHDHHRAALRGEIAFALPPHSGALDVDAINALPLLDRFMRETLRLHPPVFFIFGRAVKGFILRIGQGQYAVAKGDMLMGVIPIAQRNPAQHDLPDEFRPERFTQPAALEPMVWSHSAWDGPISDDNRACAGRDIAVIIAKLFCVLLLWKHDWRLAEQRAHWSARKVGLNMAAPIGSLKTTDFTRIK